MKKINSLFLVAACFVLVCFFVIIHFFPDFFSSSRKDTWTEDFDIYGGCHLLWIDSENLYVYPREWKRCASYLEEGQCFTINVKSKKITIPESCIECECYECWPSKIEGSLYEVFCRTEGPGRTSIISWNPGEKQKVLLENIAGNSIVIKREKDGFFYIASNSNPLTGEVPQPCDPKMLHECRFMLNEKEKEIQKYIRSCNSKNAEHKMLDNCVIEHGKGYKWKWKPGMAPQMVKELGYEYVEEENEMDKK